MAKEKGHGHLKPKRKPGRVSLSKSDAKTVIEGLRHIIKQHHGGVQQRFADAMGVSRDVTKGWLKTGKMDLRYAVQVARVHRVSLNWLLLGKGPERLDSSIIERDVSSDLRQMVLHAVRENDDADLSDAEGFFLEHRDLVSEAVRYFTSLFKEHQLETRVGQIRDAYRASLSSGSAEPIPVETVGGDFELWSKLKRVIEDENERHRRSLSGTPDSARQAGPQRQGE